MIKKYSEEKKAGGNQCTQRWRNHCTNCSTNRSKTNNGKSMAERCRMPKLKGYKSRVQFSDNPVTIVQQKKKLIFCCFFKNRRPLHPYTDFSYCLLQEKYKTEFQQNQRSCLKFRIYCHFKFYILETAINCTKKCVYFFLHFTWNIAVRCCIINICKETHNFHRST